VTRVSHGERPITAITLTVAPVSTLPKRGRDKARLMTPRDLIEAVRRRAKLNTPWPQPAGSDGPAGDLPRPDAEPDPIPT
jgi:hypothetical protein